MCYTLQTRGKGFWGKWEGMETLFKLKIAARTFIQNPINYLRVQAVLDAVPSAEGVMVKNTNNWHKSGFSGGEYSHTQTCIQYCRACTASVQCPIVGIVTKHSGSLLNQRQGIC